MKICCNWLRDLREKSFEIVDRRTDRDKRARISPKAFGSGVLKQPN